MKFIEENKLPVEIMDRALPKEKGKKYMMFYDYRKRTDGGFADALFLVALIVTSFLWGMLVIIFKG